MGLKRLSLVLVFFSIVISLISLASAGILISQPKAMYNLGDDFSADITLDSIKIGYLDVNLVCSQKSVNLYHNAPDVKTISIKRQLIPAYIQDLYGNCYLQADYNSDSSISQNFEISKNINIKPLLEEINIEAGKSVKIKGTAYKENGNTLGFSKSTITASLNENISSSSEIKNSQFEIDFLVPETTHAGIYDLVLQASDSDEEGNILNQGQTSIRFVITQKPSGIEIALDKTSLNPEENITILPTLYDKAGDNYNGIMILRILDNSSNKLFETLVSSGVSVVYIVQSNNPPGYSRISLQKDNITAEKSFYVSELKKIAAEIKDGKLTISNIGNVAYDSPVKIQVGEEQFVQEINLAYGEQKQFDLSAPDGYYNVNINDGSEIFTESQVSLTGNAISLRESGARISDLLSKYPIVWIFILVILALWLWVSYKKYRQNRRISFGFSGGKSKNQILEIKKKGGIEIINPGKVIEKIVSGEDIRKAEQVTVLHGQKQQASVIAIKVKGNVSGISEDNLSKALEIGYKEKAVSYTSGNSLILIFSPLITRKKNNEETAIKVALDIDNFLREHNRKFRNDIINYGVGVNSGEIINKIAGKVLQFANITRTISLAKKVAELANNEVLLSKEIHEKTMNSVKAEKVTSGAMDLFSVKRVVNTEASQKFINEFLQRNKK